MSDSDSMQKIRNDLFGRLDKSSKSEVDVARFERHTDLDGRVTHSIYLSNGRSFSVSSADLHATQQQLTSWLQQSGYEVSQSAERFDDFHGTRPVNVDGIVVRAKPRRRGLW